MRPFCTLLLPRRGASVVLNVSRSVFGRVREAYGDIADVVILLITASSGTLRERLGGRGRETTEEIEARVTRATRYAPPRATEFRVARVRNEGTVAAGVDRVVAALRDPATFDVAVVGLVGCSAAGKSTVCESLDAALVGGVVACDDHYRPLAECPRFDLGDIQWPTGSVPEAFLRRGDADLNHPASVDWDGVSDALDAAVDAVVDDRLLGTGATRQVLVLEGLLLLGNGAERLRDRCAKIVLLDDDYDDPEAQEALWRRKWTRSGHLGKASYKDRGVGALEYQAYWRDYVSKRWKEHGLDRAPPDVLKVDCRAPLPETAAALDAVLRRLSEPR